MVSVIVIIYKVEKYLRQCLESLEAQTYKELELILVAGKGDEGSLKICREFAEKDSRIKLIEEEPKGTACARNTGLEASTGEYIGFVDGDDYIEPDMIESLVAAMKDKDADISVAGKYYAYVNCAEPDGCMQGEGKGEGGSRIELLSTEEALSIILYQTGFFLHIWDKLYKRELFEDIRFDEGARVEDRVVSFRLIKKASRIAYLREPKYYFRVSADSGSKVEDNLSKSFDADKLICKDIEKEYPALSEACKYFLAYEAMSVIQNSMLYGSFSKEHDAEYLGYVKRFLRNVYKNDKVSRGVKLKAFLCVNFPGILNRLTIERRRKFLSGHVLFTSGTDWDKIFGEQRIE